MGAMGEDHAPLDIHVQRERAECELGSPLSSTAMSAADMVVGSTSSAAAAPTDSVSIGKPSRFSRVVRLVRVITMSMTSQGRTTKKNSKQFAKRR